MEIKEEHWKVVAGTCGNYEVSTLGRVRSMKRVGCRETYVMKAHPNGYGYPQVSLYVKGRKTQRCVHKLVAEAFIPECGKGWIRHINGDKGDNRLCNLKLQRG